MKNEENARPRSKDSLLDASSLTSSTAESGTGIAELLSILI